MDKSSLIQTRIFQFIYSLFDCFSQDKAGLLQKLLSWILVLSSGAVEQQEQSTLTMGGMVTVQCFCLESLRCFYLSPPNLPDSPLLLIIQRITDLFDPTRLNHTK